MEASLCLQDVKGERSQRPSVLKVLLTRLSRRKEEVGQEKKSGKGKRQHLLNTCSARPGSCSLSHFTPFTCAEREAERGEVTFQRSHSRCEAKLENLKPLHARNSKAVGSRAVWTSGLGQNKAGSPIVPLCLSPLLSWGRPQFPHLCRWPEFVSSCHCL